MNKIDIIAGMAYPRPEFTKSEVKRAGTILIDPKPSKDKLNWAYNVLNNWRVCHEYPLNTFNATLRNRIKSLGFQNIIVAQRLKRTPTIIKKLKRFKNMKLSTMQDIGGLRVILKTLKEAYELENKYLSDKRFTHKLVRRDDYIEEPKPEDGYRSIHLVYKYENKLASEFNGLSIELQIRTTLQHTWATAVETMGTYLGQALKSGEGEKKWRDFFALASSAFTYIEKTPPVPKYSKLGKKGTFKALAKIEKNIDALNIMSGHSFALYLIKEEKKGKSFYYHLILLDSLNKKVTVNSYAKKDIKQASIDYTQAERKATKNKGVEAVLVSAGDLRSLKTAYPNFFLDIKKFINQIENIKKRVR